jgi:hypothetical protein
MSSEIAHALMSKQYEIQPTIDYAKEVASQSVVGNYSPEIGYGRKVEQSMGNVVAFEKKDDPAKQKASYSHVKDNIIDITSMLYRNPVYDRKIA